MNLILKPAVALATTVLIGASLLSPTFAASNTRSKQMRMSAMAEQQTMVGQQMPTNANNAYNQAGNGSLLNERFNVEPNFGQNNRCITDEGYGRWSYCDAGGGN